MSYSWQEFGQDLSSAATSVAETATSAAQTAGTWIEDAWDWLGSDDPGLGQQLVLGSVASVGGYLAQKELLDYKQGLDLDLYNAKTPKQASSGTANNNIVPGQGLISERYRRQKSEES